MKKLSKICIMFLAIILLGTACQEEGNQKAQRQKEKTQEKQKVESLELMVYSGAGLKKPMEKIKEIYEKKSGNKINYIYAGSGQLLAQLESSGKGDLFIVGSEDVYKDAKEKDLVEEGNEIAHHTPVIIAGKGNPKNITGLKDLEKEGINIALGEEKSNAIGKTSQGIFKKNNMDTVSKNVVVKTATVNELYTAVEAGNADCAIVTKDGAYSQKDKFEIIEIPEEENIDQIIMSGLLKTTQNKDESKSFMELILSEEGKAIFEQYGFKRVDK